MATPVCYIVNDRIDGTIAAWFGWTPEQGKKGMNPAKIASLRGLYDQQAKENGTELLIPEDVDNPTDEQLKEAAKKLMNFRAGIRENNRVRMSKGIKHIDRAYDALRHAYSLHQRQSRISLLSNLFSSEVDRLMQGGQADRQSYVNGFMTISGEHVGGEFSILEGVYNQVLERRAAYYRAFLSPQAQFDYVSKETEDAHKKGENGPLDYVGAPTNVEEYKEMAQRRYEEYTKILENWTELIPFVLKDLVKKEGVKLGVKKEYAVAASSDSFGDNDIAAKWDMSESKRDGWMENSDLQSAFGSVGQQVRRILATVPQMQQEPQFETGTDLDGKPYRRYVGMRSIPMVDDLGNQQFMDPTKTHQELQEFLKGIQDSEDMIYRMCKNGRPGEAKIPWMQPIVDVLVSNPQARTQFFCDFKRNFQPYSIMFDDKAEGNSYIRKIKTRVLNKAKNYLKGKYDMTLSSKGKLPVNVQMWGYTPVFDEETKEVNWQRLAELRQKVLMWTKETINDTEEEQEGPNLANWKVSLLIDKGRNTTVNVNGRPQRLTQEMKREFLMEVFSSLGYDVTVDTIDSILQSRDIYAVREQLEQLFDPTGKTGLLYMLGDRGTFNERKTFRQITSGKKDEREAAVKALTDRHIKFRNLYQRPSTNGKPIQEHSEKLLDIISKHQEGYRVESRVRYNGNTMYSFVSPSYLGDRLETIQSYVENDNKVGLLQFLRNEYLNSPFFVDDEFLATNGASGRILNMWLSDLVDACKDKKTPLMESVAAIFNYERDLGREDKKFEDFTAKEHALDMFIHFFADEQQRKGYGGKGTNNLQKKLSAMYPVFILGDAGVSKYIRAPRISSAVPVDKNGKRLDMADAGKRAGVQYRFDTEAQEKVLDAFWDIYMQETRRMAMDKAIAHQMYANGKLVKHGDGEFSILTFFNDDKYAIPQGKEYDMPTIKAIIRQYLEDAAIGSEQLKKEGRRSFKQRMEDLGVLETDEKGKTYRNISSIATPDNIDDKVREFYWNTKLATAQQLQLMTIDPSFYHGTKDLQKRYKEIHAPGTVLDTKAVNFDGFLYSPDGIERVVYFNDVNVDADKTNPEFMAVMRNVFKDNPEIVEEYKKNTLTDGQGYRTLTSYRRVMGMAGRWTRDQEEAYKTIMQIRNKHIADDSDITPDEFQQITRLAQVFQPIKPYMFTHEKYPIQIAKMDAKGNKVIGTDGNPVMIDTYQYIPVQHKYAEALIIPELMPKGSKLRDLANWMEAHNVDMVGSTKIGKVGVFGQASIDAVTDKASLDTAMSRAYIHELPYSDYRIQTNVPEHINSSQLFGTQVRKLIMSGLDFKGLYDFYLNGIEGFNGTVNLSTDNEHNKECKLYGRNLLALYNSLICANIMDSYDRFAQNAGDIEALSELLQQSTVGSMREAMDNLFSYVVTGSEKDLQKFMIPLFEGGLEHDAAALILSTFKKIVNKQQISGGSAVQVSAFGIDGYEEDGGLRYVADPDNDANILYAEIEMPFDKSFMLDIKDADGNVTKQKIDLSYDKYVRQDGYLIPTGEAIEKGTPEWKKYQSYTYKEVNGELVPCKYDDPEAKVYKPLIEEDYPDILSILAYRIPTERDYSMINCHVKRFTSKTAGGTMKVPPQGTTIAGFDFDIDKLYFMQREYHKHYNDKAYVENNFSERDKLEVWSAFYEANPEIKEALETARAEAEAKDSSLVDYLPIIRKGVDTGRKRLHHKTTLNSYWEAANIEAGFGKNKGIAFAETAQAEGIKPTQNISTNTTEWMENYDFNKSPEENTRAARNNLLISLIQARLMDPATVKQRYTPGGFANASKAARLMRELFHGDLSSVFNNGIVDLNALEQRQDSNSDPEPNYDPTDPYTMLVYNQQNQVAAKLIGIFANQNTNHAFASSMDVFKLNEPIAFCGKSLSDLLHKGSDDAAQIDLNMAEFLAASVDAVKDPVLNFLNLNTITADSGALLARLGYTTKEIGLLFNQPIIRKVCEDAFNKGYSNANVAIDNAIETLLSSLTGYDPKNSMPLTEQDLAMGIVKERMMLESGKSQDDFLAADAKRQMQALLLFSHIYSAAQDISQFVTNTKFTASNAVSSTFGGMYAQQEKVDKYVEKFPKDNKGKGSLSYTMVVAQGTQETGLFSMPIDNNEDYITMSKKEYLHMVRFNPFAYEQAMYDTNRKAIKLLAKYFPYERPLYKNMRDKMGKLALYGSLSEDDINDIHSNIPVALLAKQTKSLFNGEVLHPGTNVTNRKYYREQFAAVLSDMIAKDPDGLGSLAIFKYLYPSSETVVTGIDPTTGLEKSEEIWSISMQDIGGMDADTKEEIRESWAYLMEVKDDGHFDSVEMAELGRDLFMYCFYQLGFDFSPMSFMHLAPTAVKDSIPVQRNDSIAPKHWNQEEGIKPKSDDVYVWSPSMIGGAEKASDDFDANLGYMDELSGNSFQLSEMKPNNFRKLIEEAISHPELKFKLAMDLTQNEFDELAGASEDIPSNIYFSPATITERSDRKPLSYGRKRTYRQFLNEILDGTEQGLNQDEFAQMWILNHLDNSRFVLDTAKGGDRLREIIKTVVPVNVQRNGTAFRDVITIDLSRYQNDQDEAALRNLVSIKRDPQSNRILESKWAPCIIINGSYYLAESGTDLGFNMNQDVKINYRKVVPWGASKTIEYDGNQKLTPQMQYRASLYTVPESPSSSAPTVPEASPEGSSNNIPSPITTDSSNSQGVNINMTRQQMEDYIFDEYVRAIEAKNGYMQPEDKARMRDSFVNTSSEDLATAVQMIRQACRKNGVMMLDAEGNPMQGC